MGRFAIESLHTAVGKLRVCKQGVCELRECIMITIFTFPNEQAAEHA